MYILVTRLTISIYLHCTELIYRISINYLHLYEVDCVIFKIIRIVAKCDLVVCYTLNRDTTYHIRSAPYIGASLVIL